MDFINRIEYLDQLIQERSTGRAEVLAEKLNISKRTVFNYLRWMRQRGAPIVYSQKSNSYVYEREVMFVVAFVDSTNPKAKKELLG